MNLVNTFDLNRIESGLLLRREQVIQASSWFMNMLMLGFVVAAFGFFLYVQYTATQEEAEVKRIPFKPVPWLSATRNVRSEEYGRQLQPFEIETGYGLPGPADGDSLVTVHADHATSTPIL
jgi:hypothetical protein